MSNVQSNLLENAILKFDEAEEEVDRLLDVINKANHELKNARQLKRNAKKQLDEAIASARNELLRLSNSTRDTCYSECSSGSEFDEDEGEEVEEASASSSSSGSEEVHEESDEQIVVDIADEALEQIRYRLEVAKIDPSSQNGSSIVDELLSRLKNTKDTITDELIDKLMDDLLLNKGCNDEEEEISNDEDDSDYDRGEEGSHDNIHLKQSRIKICRGGKVLGWYQGGLDDRGYSREGEGTMYYNAGHICSGFWKDDEMVGRGVYQWADGHVYDVSEGMLRLYCMFVSPCSPPSHLPPNCFLVRYVRENG